MSGLLFKSHHKVIIFHTVIIFPEFCFQKKPSTVEVLEKLDKVNINCSSVTTDTGATHYLTNSMYIVHIISKIRVDN